MLALAVLALVLAALVCTIWLIVHAERKRRAQQYTASPPSVAFGSSMAWLAIKSDDPDAVIAHLALTACRTVDWPAGLAALHARRSSDSAIFVTPAVRGWVLVAGHALPQPLGPGFADKTTPLLAELSETFGEAQYFLAYAPLDCFGWLRAIDGRVRRAFAIGDEGPIWDVGRMTSAEHALGLKFYELRGVDARAGDGGGAMLLSPTESQVTALAGRWSIDPTTLSAGSDNQTATGTLGHAPLTWRPQRASRQAAAA